MKHFQQDFGKQDQGFTEFLDSADNIFLKDNLHMYKFYFVTLIAVVLEALVFLYFIADHIKLPTLVEHLILRKNPKWKP